MQTTLLAIYRNRLCGAKFLRYKRYLFYTSTLMSCLCFFIVGYNNALMGGFINGDPFKRTFNSPKPVLLSTMVAIYEVGGLFGAVFTSIFGEVFGRRQTIGLGSILLIVGAAIQSSSFTRTQLIIGRIVSGLGIGMVNSTAPVIQAEITPKGTRGLYVAIYCSTLNFGILTVYWLDFGLSYIDSTFAWRFPTALQIGILLIIIWLTFAIPESPRWLVVHDYHDEAKKVLAVLRGYNAKIEDEEICKLFSAILKNVQLELRQGTGSWKDFYSRDGIQSARRLWTACAIQAFQQLGGINCLIYFSTSLFENSIKFSPRMSGLMSGFLQTWLLITSFIPWFLLDRVGRKPLILFGIFGQGAVMAVQAALVSQIQYNTSIKQSSAIGAAVMLFLFEMFFTIGMQSTVWVYPSEILPLRLRAKGMVRITDYSEMRQFSWKTNFKAVAVVFNWAFNFLIVQISSPAIANIGYKTYIIFAVLNFSFLPIVYFFFKEAKGMSLEDVDLLFMKQNDDRIVDEKDS